jgi:segregation and condensation protein B
MSENGKNARTQNSMEARMEALLFLSPMPISVNQFANVLEASPQKVKQALEDLDRSLARRGIRLQKHGSGFQLTSAPEFAQDIERLLEIEDTGKLSRSALEVLAIIAYQQPITRPQIDMVRGVNSDAVLRTLLRYGLIEEIGRSMGPGRPIIYSTTAEFLQYFGLSALEDLPALDPEQLSEKQERSSSDDHKQGE